MTAQPAILFDITLNPISDLDRLGREWRELELRSDRHSFFLSWHWIGSWLRCLPADIQPLVFRICIGPQTVGLAILAQRTAPILKFLSLRQVTLNVSGDAGLDSIAIEYNGFLAARGMADAIALAGLEWLMQGGVPNQVIQLDGFDSHQYELAMTAARAYGRQIHLVAQSPAPFVDLAAVRESGKDYLEHLSRNSRQSLRRAIRYYEAIGPLDYRIAATPEEALALLDKLQIAHQTYWQMRGKPGAFAKAFFKQFHIALIKSAFADGHIELAQISAGAHPIGYLYNYVWRGTVYAYQSGFCYNNGKGAKPGYVSHYLAIMTSLVKGINIYDFMAGERQHKVSLSTGRQNLTWLQLRTQLLSVRLDTRIRKLLAALHARTAR